jgi:hypothetical protein
MLPMFKKRVKRKVKKVKIIKKRVKKVKIVKGSLKQELKNAEQLPPKERKSYLKKVLISFFKGVAATAGSIALIAVIYNFSKSMVNKEIKAVVTTASTQLRSEIKQTTPVVQNEIKDMLINLEPSANNLVKQSVVSGFEEGKKQLRESKPLLNQTVKELSKSATQGTGGLLGILTKLKFRKVFSSSKPDSTGSMDSKSIKGVNSVNTFRRNIAAKIIQSRYRNLKDYQRQKGSWIPPLEPKLRSRFRGIQTVQFGKRKKRF